MKMLHDLKTKKMIILVLAALLGAVVLAWPLRDLVRKTVVVMVLYVLWEIDLVLQIIPQPILWVLFVIYISIILVKSLFIRKKSQRRRRRSASVHPGRVEELSKLVHFARESEYSRWKLAHHLVGLVSQIVAFHKQCPIEDVHDQIQNGSMGLAEDLQEYFKAGLIKTTTPQIGVLSKMLKHQRPSQEQDSALDLQPERIVQFLEDQLEEYYGEKHR